MTLCVLILALTVFWLGVSVTCSNGLDSEMDEAARIPFAEPMSDECPEVQEDSWFA
ncbi:hypothetical protein ACS8E9_06735 [Pseudomonas neustonica]|uniref:hypothetical protein n=1 Tax=Pseudomonas neustonica TaxID=2487346 RepID=UPI003F48E17A